MFAKQLQIKQTWDGRPIGFSEQIHLFFSLNHHELRLMVQAPFYGDIAPATSPGLTPRLWEYELVELFLLGEGGQYLEIELGPHGHYLVYLLSGIRKVSRQVVPHAVFCSIEGSTWQGEIRLGCEDLPRGISHVNGYGIHGQGQDRCYLAATSVPGVSPDFHQPEVFLPVAGLQEWDSKM